MDVYTFIHNDSQLYLIDVHRQRRQMLLLLPIFPPKQCIVRSIYSHALLPIDFDDELAHIRTYTHTCNADFLFSFIVSHGYFPVHNVQRIEPFSYAIFTLLILFSCWHTHFWHWKCVGITLMGSIRSFNVFQQLSLSSFVLFFIR